MKIDPQEIADNLNDEFIAITEGLNAGKYKIESCWDCMHNFSPSRSNKQDMDAEYCIYHEGFKEAIESVESLISLWKEEGR